MRHRYIALVFLVALPSSALADFPYVRPDIDPDGIKGTLVLHGDGDIPPMALDQFVKKASIAKGDIALVFSPKTRLVDVIRLKDRIANLLASVKKDRPSVSMLTLGANAGAADVLKSATGVWLDSEAELPDERLTNESALRKSFEQVLKRGGVIGGPAKFVGGLLPDAVVDTGEQSSTKKRIDAVWKKHLETVGFHFGPKSAMIVSGRRLFFLGDDPVTIHLPKGNGRPAIKQVMNGKRRYADLTALRRSAWDRTQPQFPPKLIEPPVVDNGTLIIIGGGGTPKGLLKRFVDLAGGKEASIVIFPTASPDPVPTRSGLTRIFTDAGAKKVTILPQRKLTDVESPAFLKTLKEATGIWFGGGRQWRFVDAYYGTKAHKLMLDVLNRGGVIAGSSAGASIQAEYMARGDPVGNVNIIAPGYERGLGFIKGVAIDQHFSQRRRQRDMSLLVKTYPQLLGIGIDESTAIVVKGSVADVVGRGRVFFYDKQRKRESGDTEYDAVSDGGRYDLKSRKVLSEGDAKKTEQATIAIEPVSYDNRWNNHRIEN